MSTRMHSKAPGLAPLAAPSRAAAESQAQAVAERALTGPVSWNPLSPGPSPEAVPSVPGTGEPLSPRLRGDLEQRLGADLSVVRVHRDLSAERFADSQDANAVTLGRDLYFGRGAYAPESSDGRRLLAHEAAHSVQQLRCGLLTIQRDEKKPPGKKKKKQDEPPAWVTRLTDVEKAEARTELKSIADRAAGELFAQIEAKPDIAQLEPAQKSSLDSLRQQLTTARAGAEKVADASDKSIRLATLSAAEALLSDKYFVHYYLMQPGVVQQATLGTIGNPDYKMTADDLAILSRDAALMRGGGKSIIASDALDAVYRNAKVNPEWLKTADPTADEATASGAADALTVEDKQRLQEIYAAIPDGGENRAVADPKMLAEKLRDLSAEDLEQLKEFLRQSPADPGADAPSVEEQLEQFKKLTPAERDTLLVNRELKADSPAAPKLDGKVLLDLAKADGPIKEAATEFDSNAQLIASLVTDPEKMKAYSPISIDVGLFALEMAFFRGLLAGGAARSELVRGAVTDLTAEMARAQQEIQEELLQEAALTALLMAVPLVGEAKFSAMLVKLERLRRKVEKIRKAFAIYDQVRSFLDLVRAAPEAIAEFRAFWEQAGLAYTTYLPMLQELEDSPELDEKIASFEDDLAEQFDTLLDSKFGEVLEMLYLPPDASPEELLHIIFELPKGFDALDDAWKFYQGANAEAPDAAERVLIRSAKAGALLYPLVGFLAAFASEQIGAAFPDRDIADRITAKLAGYKKNKKARGDSNRSTFFHLNRRNYDYNEADLKPYLDKGAARLTKLVEDDEPGQHWTPSWLRVALREEVQNLNHEFAKTTVAAKVKEKLPKGRKGKPVAKPAATRTEQVPLPPFRIKFIRFDKDAKNETVELSLNPTGHLKFDSLSYDDFSKPEGVPFTLSGRKKREKAIRDWLDDRDYQIVRDNSDNPHIRLRGGKTDAGGRVYLHLDNSTTPPILRSGIRKDDYKAFLDRQVEGSEDLPEGFHLATTSAGAQVARKAGVRKTDEAPMLGLDASGKLSDKHRSTLGPETKAAPGVTQATKEESYDWEAAIKTTLSGGDYHPQGVTTKAAWDRRAANTTKGDIKKRPTQVEGDLGYILRARAFGSGHDSIHLPELKNSDDKGHLVAKRFGGDDHANNLVPMKRTVNQFPGKWYDLESDMAKVYSGKDATPGHRVHLTIDIDYPTTMTRRPNRFRVLWKEQDASKNIVAGKGSGKTLPISNS